MAKIFICYGVKDVKMRRFFDSIFKTTKVKPLFREFEGLKTKKAALKILNDIQISKAVFILLSPNVKEEQFRAYWKALESAIYATAPKDIWLFESHENRNEIKITLPKVDHYMIYMQNNRHMNYLRFIIEYYRAYPPLWKVYLTFGIAIWLHLLRKKPYGIPIVCGKCKRQFNLHTQIKKSRCPLCNAQINIKLENRK